MYNVAENKLSSIAKFINNLWTSKNQFLWVAR